MSPDDSGLPQPLRLPDRLGRRRLRPFALATIPSGDVVGWDIGVGGIDDDLAPTPTDGTLTLYHPDGRYQRPGVFTDQQLRSVHPWRVTASSVEQASGRAYPAAGLPLLTTVEPSLWILEGETVPALLSRRRWQVAEGELADTAASISQQAGVTVTTTLDAVTTAEADVGDIDWTGTLTGLLGRLGRVIGGFAIQRPDSSIVLVESSLARNAPTVGQIDASTALIDATTTRVGQRADLVRTEVVVPVPTENNPRSRVTYSSSSAVTRYGRRTIVLEPWGRLRDLLIAGSVWRNPWTELEVTLLDAARNNTLTELNRLALQVLRVRPGHVINAILPNGTGGITTYKVIVVSLRLRSYGGVPERHARMMVLNDSDSDIVVPAVPGGDAPPAPRLIVQGLTVSVHWFSTRLGNADVARRSLSFPPSDPGAAAGVIVASDSASPVEGTPGVGRWQYRLRIPPSDGVWGPWATAFVTDEPMPPTLTVNVDTVTVAWPETLGAVDIRVRRLVNAALQVLVIAEDEDGTIDGVSRAYDDTPTLDVPLWYSVRHPVSSGQWSDWAGPVTHSAPHRHRAQTSGSA